MNKCAGMGRKITAGTREWADHNVNCCVGCYNDCRYCYAKKYAVRFGRATEETWKEMKVTDGLSIKPFRKMRGRVMFPTSHDIVDIPEVMEACLDTLRKLLESGNAQAWIQELSRFEENRDKLGQMGEQARRYVISNYSLLEITEKYKCVWNELSGES